MIIHARHYATGEPIEVVCDQGLIQRVGTPSDARPDLEAPWVAPALFDLQINGCHGHGFYSPNLNEAGIRAIVFACREHGIAAFCPTLLTNSFESLRGGFTTLRRVCDADPLLARAMPAFHLEGPYISPEDGPRGAHPVRHVRPPDWDEFCRLQESAAGRIRLVTLAPELPGALAFIENLARTGVVVALGHTNANRQQIQDAIHAGARLSTHLGNGSHALLPRHNNYLWEQLAADELWASIICDGQHLPPAVVRCIVRVKTAARMILTCDASTLAGLPPGNYREWDQDLLVRPDGKIIVKSSGYLAGSWSFTDQCIGNAIRFAGVSLAEAVDMASARPRELLGLPRRGLEEGLAADLMLFDWQPEGNLDVVTTLGCGP